MIARSQSHGTADSIRRRSLHARRDHHRAEKFLRAARYVEGVKSENGYTALKTRTDNIHRRVGRIGDSIDYRGSHRAQISVGSGPGGRSMRGVEQRYIP